MNIAESRAIEKKMPICACNTAINKALDEKMKELLFQVIIKDKNGYSFNTIGHDTLNYKIYKR